MLPQHQCPHHKCLMHPHCHHHIITCCHSCKECICKNYEYPQKSNVNNSQNFLKQYQTNSSYDLNTNYSYTYQNLKVYLNFVHQKNIKYILDQIHI